MSEQRIFNLSAGMFSILLIAVLIWDRKHHMLHCSVFLGYATVEGTGAFIDGDVSDAWWGSAIVYRKF
jgi:hypothetical protein